MLDLLTKKKCRLHRATLEEASKSAPRSSFASLPLLLSKCCPSDPASKQQEAKGGQKQGRAQVEGLPLLAAILRPPNPSSGGGGANKAQEPTGYSAEVVELIKSNKPALLSALTAAVIGPVLSGHFGGGKDAHLNCIKAAAAVVERLKSGFKGKRMVEVLGQEGMTALAKSVVTLRDVLDPLPGKISTQIDRLVSAAGISDDLLAKTTVDVALKGRLVKARTRVEEQRVEKKGLKQKAKVVVVKEEPNDDDDDDNGEGEKPKKVEMKAKKVKLEAQDKEKVEGKSKMLKEGKSKKRPPGDGKEDQSEKKRKK